MSSAMRSAPGSAPGSATRSTMRSVLIGAVLVAWEPVAAPPWTTSLLAPAEVARAAGFVRAEDRRRFVASHVLLRRTVGAVLDVDPAVVELGHACGACGSAEHGRPVLATDPSVQLSLSRSADCVVVAVGRGLEPIGVDVQSIGAVRFSGFDDVALTSPERATVHALPLRDRAAARADAWARKEAVLKARGVGLTVDPATVDPANSGYELTRVDVGAGHACWLAAPTAAPGDSTASR